MVLMVSRGGPRADRPGSGHYLTNVFADVVEPFATELPL